MVDGLSALGGDACACAFSLLALTDKPGRVGSERFLVLFRVSRASWIRRESRRAVQWRRRAAYDAPSPSPPNLSLLEKSRTPRSFGR